MSSIKNKLSPILNTLFDFVSTDKIINKINHIPFLPFYHAIGRNEELPHISNLYIPRNKKQFINDLDFFLQYFNPVSLDEFIFLSEKNIYKKDKPIFHLSFDDGLKEVYEIALPILEEKGIPATIFINSDFVDNKKLFFRYKISLIIEYLKQGKIKESNLMELGIKKENLLNINDAEHPIFNHYKNEFDQFLNDCQPYMNTRQLEDCIRRGFTLGGHSENHPYYSKLNLPQQIEQTKNSIDFIKNKFNLKTSAFAFPFTDYGVKNSFFKRIEKNNIVDVSFGCAGLKNDPVIFHWQRIPMEGTDLKTEEIVRMEYLYSYFSKFMGKQKIIRS